MLSVSLNDQHSRLIDFRVRWGIQSHFTASSNYSKINIPRIFLFSGSIVIVTRYVHVPYQISRISCFWVGAESVATNCPPKWGQIAAEMGHMLSSTAHPIILIVFLIVIISLDGDGNKVCACAISNF